MLKLNKFIPFLVLCMVLMAGCGAGGKNDALHPVREPSVKAAQKDSVNDSDVHTAKELKSGSVKVLSLIESMIKKMKLSSDAEINSMGAEAERKWDKIEKLVEKKYPQDYKNIEQSLYPLIAEAKKKKPDRQKLGEFSEETREKLILFQSHLNQP
jgi:iron uptake system EfeUOB component EfeO/EfeM